MDGVGQRPSLSVPPHLPDFEGDSPLPNLLYAFMPWFAGNSGQKAQGAEAQSLARRLGYAEQDRVLIINCDDFGSSHSANQAIERALRKGIATSASLMVPCPWAERAARASQDLDIGIHLTLTSEYPAYRWPSLTGAVSLHDKHGYLPRTTREVWARAEMDDVERECRAQIERALEWGVDVTHLNSHMDVMQLDSHFFGCLLRLATDYRLPVRLCRSGSQWPFSKIGMRTIKAAHIVATDRYVVPAWGEPCRPLLNDAANKLATGVTEVALHPVDDGEELRAYDTEFADLRAADAECLIDESIGRKLSAQGFKLIGFRPLRDAMRRELRA